MKKSLLFGMTGALIAVCALCSCDPSNSGGGKIDKTPDLTIDVSNHEDITITGVYPNFGCSDDKMKNGWLANAIVDTAKYNTTFRQLSESGDTELNKILTMKEEVDMIKMAPTCFNNYVVDGYFTDLTDVIAKYGQRVVDDKGTKFVDLFTQAQWDACTYNGKIYAIPEYGHSCLASEALVWNKDHLTEVGITKIPETITEFDTAVHALQDHFGSNKNYHAFGLTGNISINNCISPAFGVPMNWYEDSEGKLQNMFMSDEMEHYFKYMNGLKRDSIIVADWSGTGETNAMNNFTKGYCSVYSGSYWNIKALRKQLVASYQSFPDDVISTTAKTNYVRGETTCVDFKDDAMVSWRRGIKGDGSFDSKVQDRIMYRDARTVGYFITVPATNCKRAAYVVDWLTYKNSAECTALVAGGVEGRHWEYCQATDEGAIKLNKTPDTYVKKLDAYDDEISGMEQYQTGVNCDEAKIWWPLAERGFDAWSCLIDENDIIGDAFSLHPVLEQFAKYDLNAQNFVVTNAQAIINAKDDETFNSKLTKQRESYNTKYYNKFADEINTWYQQSKQA